MRKLLIPLLSSMLVLSSACKKNDSENSLFGEWKIVSKSAKYALPGEGPVIYPETIKERIELKIQTESTLESYEPTPAPAPSSHAWIKGTYSIHGDQITINLPNYPNTGVPRIQTFTLTDNSKALKLIYDAPGANYNGVPIKYEITTNYVKVN